MKKYNILEYYKESHIKYYQVNEILYVPDIDAFALNNEEITFLRENIVLYETRSKELRYEFSMFFTKTIKFLLNNLDDNFQVILFYKSNFDFKSKIRTYKGFLKRKFKNTIGEHNILEIEVNKNDTESCFLTTLKITNQNIDKLINSNINIDANFLCLLTTDKSNFFSDVFLSNRYSTGGNYNLKEIVFSLLNTEVSLVQFNNFDYDCIVCKLYAHKDNEDFFDKLLR